MNNSFSSSRINPYIKLLFIFFVTAVIGVAYKLKGPIVLAAAIVIPTFLGYIIAVFRWPKLGLYTSMALSFLIPFLNRYVYNDLPYGFIVEFILLFVYIVLFFKHFKKLDFSLAKNDIVLMLGVWMVYIILQLANPLAQSVMAWFYSMRGIALIQLLIIPLAFVLLNTKKDLKAFLAIYFILSAVGILWGIKQQLIGISQTEHDYLYNTEAYTTHILHGKLRVFSYYFDAGTFGSAMGQLCIICAILFMGPFKKHFKALFLILAIGAFYAMMISGTRGSLAIPAVGAVVFVILIKQIKYIAIGATIIIISFAFLKFTYIGQGNYNVNRLRTAINPTEDGSFNVRVRNREALTVYLKGKPFGGGVGSAGSWGQRFTPNTWLANFATDGLYTRIRAETGIVGYILYLIIWLYILFRAFKVCWNLKTLKYKSIATAFLAGYAGILVANYGNSVMTQYPNNFITFITLTFIFAIDRWDKKENEVPAVSDIDTA